MTEFVTGLEHLKTTKEEPKLSTGSPELDKLIGWIHGSLFYLFYSSEKWLIEMLFNHLAVNALKPNKRGAPFVIYILCGNYRRERTNLAVEELAELVEDSGLDMKEALTRLLVLTASSADQQALLVGELERLLSQEENVSLILIRGIYKLNKDDARVKGRHVVWEEVQWSITRLRQLCAERGMPLVASGREVRAKGINIPESSSFLRHIANVIVYLRKRQRSSKYNRAYLIDHPLRPPDSVEYHFMVNEDMGRETKPFRQSFYDMVDRLRRGFNQALLQRGRRDAFDELVNAWAEELGAMSYDEALKLIDKMLFVAVLENLNRSMVLRGNMEILEARMQRLEEKLG